MKWRINNNPSSYNKVSDKDVYKMTYNESSFIQF